MKLFQRLAEYSVQDNMAGMILTVTKMAKVSRSDVGVVREFTLQHAGKFLGPVAGLPLRMPPLWVFSHARDILDKKLEELPPYLVSEYGFERDVANYRYGELGRVCTSK